VLVVGESSPSHFKPTTN